MILMSARTKSLPVTGMGVGLGLGFDNLYYCIIIVYLFLLRIAPFFSFDQSH